MPQCPNCGAYVSPHDKVCSYCGAPNPAYQPPADDVNLLLQQGMDAFQQHQYAVAADRYRQALDRDPDIFDAYFYLAASLSALGREKEAIAAMKKAREIRPGNASVDYNLGVLYKNLGQAREARAYLESARMKAGADPALEDRKRMTKTIERELKALPSL